MGITVHGDGKLKGGAGFMTGWFKMNNHLIDLIALIGPMQWIVFIVLLRHQDSDCEAYPSEETIAGYIGCSQRTVRRALNMLREFGWITIHYKGHNGTNSYTLHPPKDPDADVLVELQDPDTGGQEPGHPCPPDPDTGVQEDPLVSIPERDQRRRPKNKNPLPPKTEIVFPPALDTEEVQRAVQEWLDHHRAIGKPYKRPATQFAKIFKQFPTSAEFIAAVDHSIANNYQGLYAPGGKHGSRKTTDRRSSRF